MFMQTCNGYGCYATPVDEGGSGMLTFRSVNLQHIQHQYCPPPWYTLAVMTDDVLSSYPAYAWDVFYPKTPNIILTAEAQCLLQFVHILFLRQKWKKHTFPFKNHNSRQWPMKILTESMLTARYINKWTLKTGSSFDDTDVLMNMCQLPQHRLGFSTCSSESRRHHLVRNGPRSLWSLGLSARRRSCCGRNTCEGRP